MSVPSGAIPASPTAEPTSHRHRAWPAHAALLLAYLGLSTAAYIGSPIVVVGLSAVVFGCECVSVVITARRGRRRPDVGWRMDVRWRGMVRGAAALILAAAVDIDERLLALTVAGFVAFAALNLVGAELLALVRRQRRLPLLTRGLDPGPVRVPKAPLPALVGAGAKLPSLLDLTLPVGLALGLMTESWTVAVAVSSGGAAAMALAMLPLVRSALAMRRLPIGRMRSAVRWALTETNPRIVVYFGSHASELYRLESWLATFERLGDPVLVVVRDREAFGSLGPTRLPILYAADATELARVELPELALVLYVSPDANNADLRRRRGPRHVYIGHGDSDRPRSTSPLILGYDEVWVAGSAGRQRLLTAELGLDERRIVEIGRPQLDELAAMPVRPAEYPTLILYAPTVPDPDGGLPQCSLVTFGVDLVRWLLDEPDVCVLYRPHPEIELAAAPVRGAHRRIVGLLGREARVPAPAAPGPTSRDELSIAGAMTSRMSRTERDAALEVWSRKQLERVRHDQRHLYAPGPHFSLRTCFAAADGMICDISAVVSDFVVTGKPYAVTNPDDYATYAERHFTTRGGYIVAPDGRGLDELLTAARGDGDALRSTRIALREQVVGPAKPPALERMRMQVRRLVPDRPEAFIPTPATDTSADARWKV